jgi:hypothetical protein
MADLDLEKGLVLHLSFDEGAEDAVTPNQFMDKSKYQNHGTKANQTILVKPYEDEDESEGKNPVVVYDDDETFWTKYTSGAPAGAYDITLAEETSEVEKGSSSLELAISAGTATKVGAQHAYGVVEDWAHKDLISFWFYGINSSDQWTFQLDSAGAWSKWYFTDNFSGWTRIILFLERPDANGGGGVDLTAINNVRIWNEAPSGTGTTYFDRLTIDVGNWRFGEAAYFDATNDKIDIANDSSLLFADDFTISAWVKRLDRYGLNAYIWCNSETTGSPMLLFGSNNKLRLTFVGGSSLDSVSTITDYEWHHVLCTKEGTTWTLYIDGLYENSASNSDLYIPNNNGFTVSHNTNPFGGYIDELRLYNRALSPIEVRALYEAKVK